MSHAFVVENIRAIPNLRLVIHLLSVRILSFVKQNHWTPSSSSHFHPPPPQPISASVIETSNNVYYLAGKHKIHIEFNKKQLFHIKVTFPMQIGRLLNIQLFDCWLGWWSRRIKLIDRAVGNVAMSHE